MSTNQIEAAALTTFDVHPDGTHVRINVEDSQGMPAALTLPAGCLNQLMMTLPRIAEEALRKTHHNDTLRLVHPLTCIDLEFGNKGSDGQQQFIMTLETTGGFAVSFVTSESELTDLACAIFSEISGSSAAGALPH
ncbi:MAG TPA: hypothetical protein VMH83_14500 [Candidatus Acidoferrum sp.]|nr:hypothetical protein [Candidatus Acidoferrum sp.]